MKVLNTAIPVGLNMPTGKVGRKWTKVYIDNLGEFIELMQIDSVRHKAIGGGTDQYGVSVVAVQGVRLCDLKVKLLSNGVVVAKGKLPS